MGDITMIMQREVKVIYCEYNDMKKVSVECIFIITGPIIGSFSAREQD